MLKLATALRDIVCLAEVALVRKLQKTEHTHTHTLSLKNAIPSLSCKGSFISNSVGQDYHPAS